MLSANDQHGEQVIAWEVTKGTSENKVINSPEV